MIARRIIARGDLFPCQHVEPAKSGEPRCHATIELDGNAYRCARASRSGFHEGIHDALCSHGDGGAVRW